MYTDKDGLSATYSPVSRELALFSRETGEIWLVARLKRVPVVVFEVEEVLLRRNNVSLPLEDIPLDNGSVATVIADNKLTRYLEGERLKYDSLRWCSHCGDWKQE